MDLLITLGHNSSAISVDNGKILAGFEEERLTRKKADSSFPLKSIKAIGEKPEKIFISHWYDDFDFYKKAPFNDTLGRHYNLPFIHSLGAEIISLDKNFTHHDAHLYSAIAFLESHAKSEQIIGKKFHAFVSDGFGNGQEVLSIYSIQFNNDATFSIILEERICGYTNSLGLLYQYATSYVGMKENEDEYKFLGYESHISEFFSGNQINYLSIEADKYIEAWFDSTFIEPIFDRNYIDIVSLTQTKREMYSNFNELIRNIPNIVSYELPVKALRAAIGFYIQNIIEGIYERLLNKYKVENALLVGGLHFNVKLNHMILNRVPEYVCVMPLAGDQGAALGLYRKHVGKLNINSLFWGTRYFSSTLSNEALAYDVSDHILNDGIAEVITGNMEFGPRALCNTSTLALPYRKNIDFINAFNGRDTVMPMAPVILERNLSYFFDYKEFSRVIGSDKYMILTYNYKQDLFDDVYHGVMHRYPLVSVYSGRPQVISDPDSYIYKVLDAIDKIKGIKAIINHSFNIHGTPIVYSREDGLDNLNEQRKLMDELKMDSSRVKLFIG